MTRSNGSPSKELVQKTEERIDALVSEEALVLPPGYAWQNALKSAWLILQDATIPFGAQQGKRVLDVVTEKSVANALLDMVVQGLNPAAKQGYFIPYGQTLTFQRSYFGSVAVAKRVAGVEDVRALVIYADDEVELEVVDGRRRIVSHRQTFQSIREGTMVGAYAIIDFRTERPPVVDVMTVEEIRTSWKQSKTKGGTHASFPEEMARRTVIQRALKPIINTATDEYLFLDAYNRDDGTLTVEAELEEELEAEPIDVEVPDLLRTRGSESPEELEEEPPPSGDTAPPAEEQEGGTPPASESESASPEASEATDGSLPQQLPF